MIKMNQLAFGAVLGITLAIASSFPMQTCDKLKGVKDGVDNYNHYLVKLTSRNYSDAEYVVNLVNQYQTTLDQHASNVHDPLIRSQLEISENVAGVLHGILTQQALLLVCLDSRVEIIIPDYPKSAILPQSSSNVEDISKPSCPKLVIKGPYSGNNYTVIFKPKASLNTMFHVITIMELAKQNDSSVVFHFYYSINKSKRIIMMVEMNNKAIEMICKERKVKQIKPSHDTSTNKRDVITDGFQHYMQ